MTAEVAVMNRLAVALAADSAVTIGQDAKKIYISAEKLFQLSSTAPVGIMFYGNASFVNLPWETVIKAFRAEIGNTIENSIDEYGNRFIRFLTKNEPLFPQKAQATQISALVAGLYYAVRDEFSRELQKTAEGGVELTDEKVAEIANGVVKNWLELCRREKVIDGLEANVDEEIRTKHGGLVGEIQDQFFGSLPIDREQLTTLAVEMLHREFFYPLVSGIVIAGFGRKEYMPAMVAYELEGMIMGIPRKRQVASAKISDDCGGIIRPFAQKEPVDQFMRGISPRLHEYMSKTTSEVVQKGINLILDKLATENAEWATALSNAVLPEITQILEKLSGDWQEQQKNYWTPVIDTVTVAPKDELGEMAEALVNLTKFRSRVTLERETVGGPIDVAVITKGDGFVWLKRKHYFDPKLNPRIMARFAKENSP